MAFIKLPKRYSLLDIYIFDIHKSFKLMTDRKSNETPVANPKPARHELHEPRPKSSKSTSLKLAMKAAPNRTGVPTCVLRGVLSAAQVNRTRVPLYVSTYPLYTDYRWTRDYTT